MYRLSLAMFVFGSMLMLYACSKPAEGSHNILLPYAGSTWIQGQLRATQEQAWCMDNRAASYPGFASQLRETNQQYADLVGIRSREVGFADPGCQVRHVMEPAFPCGSGAAACIYYANNPVTVHYQESLGYADWRSAQAHELGHGLLTLHERYIDSGGVIQCGGTAEVGLTVMQCGPPFVRIPMPLDIERGCPALATSWCGRQPAPPNCEGAFSEAHPWMRYDVCLGRWVNTANGWSVNPSDDSWYDPNGVATWSGCNSDRLRWNHKNQQWDGNGSYYFKPSEGFWSAMPPC